jgi:hypothetical protein
MANAVTLATIRDFFEVKTAQFMKEWQELSDQDKADIRQGFEDGSMTY